MSSTNCLSDWLLVKRKDSDVGCSLIEKTSEIEYVVDEELRDRSWQRSILHRYRENFREILRSQYHYERHSVCDSNIGRIFTISIVIARQYISTQDVIRCSQYTKIFLSREKSSMTSEFDLCICKYINVPNLGVFSCTRIYQWYHRELFFPIIMPSI